MKYSKVFPKTRREDPKDAPSPGTRLLIRGGFIEQLAGGIWIMSPLGLMARRQAETIVREEMERAEAVELEVPILHPRELWDETDRWRKYMNAGIAFHLKDRKGAEFILAPTAEEPITDFARNNIRTYRDLPITLFQMNPKFRDEFRPRQGLIRGREFLMKDAYSFDVDAGGMRRSYQAMDDAYNRVFQRCGFTFIRVEADSGAIGGSGSAEFMAVTEFGEDVLLYCSACHYGGNQEKATAFFPSYPEEPLEELKRLNTPNIRTVEELEEFVSLPAARMVKTIVLAADGKPVIVSMRGDLEISEIKLANLLKAEKVETADAETVEAVTGAPVGFAGPINLFGKTEVPYYFDRSVEQLRNFLCGGNEQDVHYVGVNAGRDFPPILAFHDLSKAVAGQHCSNCKQGVFEERRGIELGHIFQLQQAYSRPMQATYVDVDGSKKLYWMGCYGIGVSRIVQAIVEQSYDERGIIWPLALTPFQVVVIPVNSEDHFKEAAEIYRQFTAAGIRTLFDDRKARIGEKLTDAELLGWPFQVLVGRSWVSERKIEVRSRNPKQFDTSLFRASEGNALPTTFLEVDPFIDYLRLLIAKR